MAVNKSTAYSREWVKKHPDQNRKNKREWACKHREAIKKDSAAHAAYLAKQREYSATSVARRTPSQKQRIADKNREWVSANRDRARENNRRERDRVRIQTLEAYGSNCQCCGERRKEFLSIDHIRNDGAEERRRLKTRAGLPFYRWLRKQGYPAGYQVLCFNCNMAKGIWGYCPHACQ